MKVFRLIHKIIFTFLFIIPSEVLALENKVMGGDLFTYIGLAIFILILVLALFLIFNVISLVVHTPKIHEKEKEVTEIIEHLTDGIIEHDKKNTVLLLNSRAEEILGIQKEKILGHQITVQSKTSSYDPFGNLSKIFSIQNNSKTDGKAEQKNIEVKIKKPLEKNIVIIPV